MNNDVVIGLLSYGMRPDEGVSAFLLDEVHRIRTQLGRTVHIHRRLGCGVIPHARNGILSDFHHYGYADLIMMDDDNHPEAGAFVRLLQQPVDVVAYPCRSRKEPYTWPVRWLMDRPITRDAKTGLVEVESVGTGLMRISRECAASLIAEHQDSWYVDASAQSGKSYDIFQFRAADHVYWGEDIWFCRLWRQLGGQVWIDPDMTTHHYGIHDYSASIGRWLVESGEQIKFHDVGGPNPALIAANTLSGRLLSKSVALVIASRGNPQMLYETVKKNLETSALANTKIIVCLDDDDETKPEADGLLAGLKSDKVIGVSNPREDSIGAAYNRALQIPADYYIDGADDVVITTQAWDARILAEDAHFQDGIGAIGFGKHPIPYAMPCLIAASRKLIDHMGYFLQPYTPFWWMDTWLWEISCMVGRLKMIEIDIMHSRFGSTRGMREVSWWAKFFRATRIERKRIAVSVLMSDDFKPSTVNREERLRMMDATCGELENFGACLLDEEYVRTNIEPMGHSAPADDRYLRIKDRAERMLERIAS